MTNDASLCYVVGAMPLDPGFILTPVPGDLVIAADKGYETLSRLGVHPGLVVGDFDSLGSVPDHPQVLRLPRVKDETDTGFALRQGLKRGYRRFVLLGCLGGRLDHTVANLQLLSWLSAQGAQAFCWEKARRQPWSLKGRSPSPPPWRASSPCSAPAVLPGASPWRV